MFFIFGFDLFLYVILVVLFLVMLALFPVFTLIVTGLIIWALVAAFMGRGGEDD